ncbi:hypothetical protein SBADM41S_10513 [Streptomyces badius]
MRVPAVTAGARCPGHAVRSGLRAFRARALEIRPGAAVSGAPGSGRAGSGVAAPGSERSATRSSDMSAGLPTAALSPVIAARVTSTRTVAAKSGTATSAISSAVVATSSTVPIRRPAFDQEGQPLLDPVAVGDVERVLAHPEDVPVGVLQPVVGAGPQAVPPRVAGRLPPEVQVEDRFAGVDHLVHDAVERLRIARRHEGAAGVQLVGPHAPERGQRLPDLPFVGGVAPGQPQIGVVDRQPDGRLGGQPLEQGEPGLPVPQFAHLGRHQNPVRGAGRGSPPRPAAGTSP